MIVVDASVLYEVLTNGKHAEAAMAALARFIGSVSSSWRERIREMSSWSSV